MKSFTLIHRPLFGLVSLLFAAMVPITAQAQILAYKQLQSMFRQGAAWHLVFVETLANTGSEKVEGVQIESDLTSLGSNRRVRMLREAPQIQREQGGGQVVGAAALNLAYDGETDKNLLADGASLGPGELLQVVYSVDLTLGSGPYAVQSVASPGGDLSQNGEKDHQSNQDFDTPTYISLPRTESFSGNACPGGQLESRFNLITNSDFLKVTGLHPSSEEPLHVESGPNQLLAGSFYSESVYAGDDAFTPDNNNNGAYQFDFSNAVAIHQANVGTGITLYDNTFFQHPFPGDDSRQLKGAPNYLLYNGNRASQPIDVWAQQLSGLSAGATYHFIVYASNAAWPGLNGAVVQPPQLRLVARGDGEQVSGVFTIPQEAAEEQDTWRPVSFQFAAPPNGTVELAIEDQVTNHIFGDRLALAEPRLFKCVVSGEDDDQDGLTNEQEVTLGTNPDSGDSDGDGKSDSDEVGPGVSRPRDADGDGVIDALESSVADAAGDGKSDEVDAVDDGPNGDADADGISNGDERKIGSDPNNPDTDGDGKPDSVEYSQGDTDGDGIPNILESDKKDTDGDGLPDEFDNFDNRPKGSGGGGGSAGFGLALLAGLGLAWRRRSMRRR